MCFLKEKEIPPARHHTSCFPYLHTYSCPQPEEDPAVILICRGGPQGFAPVITPVHRPPQHGLPISGNFSRLGFVSSSFLFPSAHHGPQHCWGNKGESRDQDINTQKFIKGKKKTCMNEEMPWREGRQPQSRRENFALWVPIPIHSLTMCGLSFVKSLRSLLP